MVEDCLPTVQCHELSSHSEDLWHHTKKKKKTVPKLLVDNIRETPLCTLYDWNTALNVLMSIKIWILQEQRTRGKRNNHRRKSFKEINGFAFLCKDHLWNKWIKDESF